MYPETDHPTIGVFSTWDEADEAIADLLDAGFAEREIGVATKDAHTRTVRSPDPDDTESDTGEDAATGAVSGALAGATIGGLVGLGVLSGIIPVIGPALFAGTMGVLASNAAGGAAVAGIIGALTGWGVSDDDAKHYAEELAAGRVIVTVHGGSRSDEVRRILRSHGARMKDVPSRSSVGD